MPWGQSLGDFEIQLTTPGLYQPSSNYILSRYSYKEGSISSETIAADGEGKLSIKSSAGSGEEIGINGPGTLPPIFVLTDTVNENIYLEDGVAMNISSEIINLSLKPQVVDFRVSTENSEMLTILSSPERMTIPSQTKIRVDSFFKCKGKYLSSKTNIGYVQISASIDGKPLDRVQYRQVQVKPASIILDASRVRILDGQTDTLAVFKYDWGTWKPLKEDVIMEGKGNGNGVVEAG